MPGADTQSFEGILKDVFEDFVSEQVNNKHPLKELFRFQDKGFNGGREIVYSSHVRRNVSPMFTRERGAFAEAGQQGHVQVRVGQRKMMARAELTWEGIHDTPGGQESFKQGKKDEMQALINDIARREEYAISTDGRGVVAFADGSPAQTLELDAPAGISGDDFGNRFIDEGMYLAAVNPGTGQLRTGVFKVTAVNEDGSDVTLDGDPSGWSDNDYIVQAANASVTDVFDTSYEAAWWGLMALIDDGTFRQNYFEVDRNTYPQFNSYVVGNTGALSMDLLQRVSDVVDQKLGGSIDLLVAHHSIRRLYIQLTEADRRYSAGNLRSPDAGTVAFKQGDMTVGEVTFKAVRTFPLGRMMLLDKANSDFVSYTSEKGKWVDEDGSILVRVGIGSSARDAFEAWYRMRKQNHVRYPGYNARLDGITGQSLVVVRAA